MDANKIIELLGGKSNIVTMVNCMTRLRPTLKDANAVDWMELKNIPEILHIVDDYTVTPMLILGPGKAEKACKEINSILNPEVPQSNPEDKNTNTAIIKKRRSKNVFRFISSVFMPIIPLLAGSGLLFGIYNIIYTIMYRCGQSAEAINAMMFMATFKVIVSVFFELLNIAIAMEACEVAGGNKFLGLVVGGLITFVTTFMAANVNNPVLFEFLGKPFRLFENGRGGAIAAMAAGFLIGLCDKQLKKRMPPALSIHIPSLISILVVGLLTLFAIQPVAGFISLGIGQAVNWFLNSLKIPLGPNYAFNFGYIFIAMPYLVFVMFGVHHALKPIETMLLDKSTGLGYSPLTTATSLGGAGQIGCACGLLARYGKKNQRLKKTTVEALPVACLGIGEPMIYGVTLPLGRSFVWSIVGAGIGAIALGFFPKFGALTTDCNGFLGIIVDVNPLAYAVSYAVAIGGGFLFSYFFGVKKSVLREYEKAGLKKDQIAKLPTYVSTPCKGEVSKIDNFDNGFMLRPKFNKYLPYGRINSPITGHVISINKADKSVIIKNISDVEVKIVAYFSEKAIKVMPKIGDEIVEGQMLFRITKKEINGSLDNTKVLVKLNNEYKFTNVTTKIKPGYNPSETDIITVLANYY